MIDLSTKIIRYKKPIVIIFFILTIISAVATLGVSINYNMADYLPEDSPSMNAVDLMDAEFESGVENARVLLNDVSVQEALDYKKQLEEIDGVNEVMWLDDAIDLKKPLEMADKDTVETYYKESNALISLHIREGDEVAITDKIYELIGDENALAGEAVDTASSQKMAGQESAYAAMLLVPIIIIILIVSTNSWMEPVFFLTAIGVSVLINLGTNIFLGEISFVTQSVAPILQLAVSLDYAIFLLHSFSNFRDRGEEPTTAMRSAMKQSFSAITASASTTFFGFIALTFMNFEIGADLGVNLVKGIVLSFISVMVFLPALTLTFYKWIDKTQHKAIIPRFKNVGSRVLKLRVPVLLFILLLIVPAFLAQSNTNFIYGTGTQPEDTRIGRDDAMIEDVFGKMTPMVLLVPRGDVAKEEELVQELKDIDDVSSVMAYVNTVDPAIPPEYLGDSVTNQFYSDNYARIILNTTTDSEGEEAFSLIETVRSDMESFYNGEGYLLGESVTLYDMKSVVQKDNVVVNLLTVISIALVLLVTFRSLTIPIVLLLTIEAAVWINLAVPYFMDTSLVYVGYLIISTVQLAATVDYGILLTEAYNENRKKMPALQAIKKTINEKIFSIIISASILSSVGFILWATSTNPIVSSIGLLLGRGALLAFIMVVVFLPAMLVIFDKVIKKTTWKSNFYEGEDK
ncbi:MMPL family transporter [Gracilibacillus caseinilyticus]|uniref:MMPL family transporter n=1 Tax=Gracilibacillus caseinilyticus TaxID=2932256 RepID=A0ABY4ERC7_9BACI|nr:MMPL family transporter [Gracilibacillus caseinilyticus]UOQ46990.1 MMPL family transporter [Gracilibacillus caseinilyticus]